MVKQCGYCFRVMGEDGQYHAIELRAPIGLLQVAPPKTENIPVSHGICGECFQVMLFPKSEVPANGLIQAEAAPEAATQPEPNTASAAN
ncbi:MAG: hypothetical protein VCE91_13020 [Nitrospinota bacterium]